MTTEYRPYRSITVVSGTYNIWINDANMVFVSGPGFSGVHGCHDAIAFNEEDAMKAAEKYLNGTGRNKKY